jgi:GMP synthase-like glutamine amidotransferase
MKVQVLQHVPFEDIGSMRAWFATRGAELQYTRFFESPELPSPAEPDLIVAMGGPMSVNDEDAYPWLRREKQFVREAIAQGVPALGICLGAQLIANALGARVYPNAHKEIGWFPIEGTAVPEGRFRFPERSEVFHWHGETFDLPPNAVRLARSAVCENQAFQIGERVIGLQFHLETTPESADSIITHCRDELVAGAPYIQSEAELRNTPAAAYTAINRLMEQVLTYLTA